MTVSKTIKVKQGSKLEWIVRATNFEEQSGVIDVVTENTSLPIYLIGNTNNTATLSFNHTPEDATVMINDVVGNNQKIRKGLTANWEVSADRYYSQSGTTDRMYDNLEIPIDLVGPHIILSIKTNKDVYTVKINGVEGNNQWVLKGTKATYSVELYGYETISGTTDELYEDTTLEFTMRKAPYDLKDVAYWTASGDKSGFSMGSNNEINKSWTMTLNRRAVLASAEVNSNYWNSSYFGRIDIYFKDGTSWKSDSEGSSTPSNTNSTYPNFICTYKGGGSGYRYRKYRQWGECNPYRELSHIYFNHWHFSSSGDIDTSAYVSSLLGYWANTLLINSNVPATITIDGNVYTNVTTAEFYTLADEIDDTREIAYSIEAEGYMPQSGTLVLNKDVTLDIVLEELYPVTFTINPTPADATVIINGEERNTIEIMQLEEVNWEISYEGYDTEIGSMVMYENTIKDISLDVEFTEIEYTTPGTYSLNLKFEDTYEVRVVGAGGGAASVDNPRAHGGCGGHIFGRFILPKALYTITVGKGGTSTFKYVSGAYSNTARGSGGGSSNIRNSANNININANGGGGAYAFRDKYGYTHTGGTGGGTYLGATQVSITTNKTGATGNGDTGYSTPPSAPYSTYGCGGTAAYSSSGMKDGTGGYVYIKRIKGS